jgi:glycosyltransferase involved in cell wall biosynthesis
MLRALPDLQARRPEGRVAIIGGDEISYGGRLPGGQTFRQKLTEELGERVDFSRVHFLGRVPYTDLVNLLRLARALVYLTTPFVVSWSLLEAMTLEKTIIAADVAQVRQYMEDGRTGFLVDFFSPADIAARIADALDHPEGFRAIGQAATSPPTTISSRSAMPNSSASSTPA